MKRVLSWKYSIVPWCDDSYRVKAQPYLWGIRVPLMPFYLVTAYTRHNDKRLYEFELDTEHRYFVVRQSVEEAKAALLRHIWESGKHEYACRSYDRAKAAHRLTGEIPVPPWNTTP